MNFVYILLCNDNTLYTGWTNNLKQRLNNHQNKKGAKYTKYRTPLSLVYFEEFELKVDAMKREYEIKQYPRIKKLQLIEGFNKALLEEYN